MAFFCFQLTSDDSGAGTATTCSAAGALSPLAASVHCLYTCLWPCVQVLALMLASPTLNRKVIGLFWCTMSPPGPQ